MQIRVSAIGSARSAVASSHQPLRDLFGTRRQARQLLAAEYAHSNLSPQWSVKLRSLQLHSFSGLFQVRVGAASHERQQTSEAFQPLLLQR